MKIFKYLLIITFVFGCNAINATEYDDYSDEEFEDYQEETVIDDKFEKLNRKVFDFNQFFINNVARPVGKCYKIIIPNFIRTSITNVLGVLKEPITFTNSILQLDFKNAGKSVAKIHTNLVGGIFGTRNVAKQFDKVDSKKKDFGQTLAFFGIANGPFFMVPFFGPYYLRDGFGAAIDLLASSNINGNSNFFRNKVMNEDEFGLTVYTIDFLDKIDTVETLDRTLLSKSFDPYVMMRNSYIELRKNKLLELTNRGN